MELWPAAIIIFCAFGGFVLASYLNRKKSRPEPMVCPLKGDCAAVIRSKYSTFFGIGVEKIGMAYYATVAILYGVFLVWPPAYTPTVMFVVLGASAAAFLFSLYLTFIQVGFLREICTWCLLSALLSTVIFFASVIASDFSFVPLLTAWQPLFGFLALLGLMLGVGGATFGDIFFLQFLKDLKISEGESKTLTTTSQITWLGLGVLVLSSTTYFLGDVGTLMSSGSFVALLGVLGILVVVSAFLNLKTMPHLVQISFGDDPHKNAEEELQRQRKIAFALSGISIVSWYSALALGILPIPGASVVTLLGIYVGLVVVGLGVSQVLERHYGQKIMN